MFAEMETEAAAGIMACLEYDFGAATLALMEAAGQKFFNWQKRSSGPRHFNQQDDSQLLRLPVPRFPSYHSCSSKVLSHF